MVGVRSQLSADGGAGGARPALRLSVGPDFNPATGADATQRFAPGRGQDRLLSFQWADPFYTHTGVGAKSDLDVLVYDAAGN